MPIRTFRRGICGLWTRPKHLIGLLRGLLLGKLKLMPAGRLPEGQIARLLDELRSGTFPSQRDLLKSPTGLPLKGDDEVRHPSRQWQSVVGPSRVWDCTDSIYSIRFGMIRPVVSPLGPGSTTRGSSRAICCTWMAGMTCTYTHSSTVPEPDISLVAGWGSISVPTRRRLLIPASSSNRSLCRRGSPCGAARQLVHSDDRRRYLDPSVR